MLSSYDIEQIKNKIVSKFNPKKMFLFGSYAYGSPTDESDVDILVIEENLKDSDAYAYAISKALYPRSYSLDLVCYDESKYMQKIKDNWSIFKEINNKGKLLYER